MSSVTAGHLTALRAEDTSKPELGFLAGGGEMGERTRAKDWAGTPAGPVEKWSSTLKAAVSICLGSRHPMVLWWGRRDYTQFYNDAYISFLGSKHPTCLGESARECWSEIWPVIGPMLESVHATGEATWSEDLLLVLDRHLPREEAYFTFSYSPIREGDGTIGGIFCACNETTARVIGERRLTILRDLNRVVAEAKTAETACEVAARILGRNLGDIPYALIYLLNPAAPEAVLAAATGLPAGSRAAPARLALDESSKSAGSWPLARALDTGAAQHVIDVVARFGELPGGLWLEPSEAALIVPIAAPGQARPTGFLISGLSPRRVIDADYESFLLLLAGHIGTSIANARAYEEERRRVEALAEIDRLKTAFFSNVSHEFRTPLTLMLGPIEQAAESPAVAAPIRTQLELAHRNSLRLLKLVNSLLDFSRIEAGRMQASYEPTALEAHTSDLASTFRSAMERAGLTFSVECEALGEPVYVDREMWEKIVLNLLSNAFKFTLQGTVAVRLRRESDAALLEVSDTGVGVAGHELPHLFERFYRVEGARGRTQEGSGIGLALVHELAKIHGGSVSVASELGRGTTFRVRVPLGTAHLNPARIKAPRSAASTAIAARAFVEEALRWIPDDSGEGSSQPPSFGEDWASADAHAIEAAGARILLADDNADMRAYVRDLLAPAYRVETAIDGAEALEAARRERPDLVLADIMMPRLDGLALLKALRADEALRDVPVILLSARAGEEARIEGLDAGADDYLVKPFFARELLARIGARLELVRMRRKHEEVLREREEQLRLATEVAEVGLWDVDLIADKLYWPARVKAMFGISPDVEVSMDDFYSGLHPADRRRTSDAFAAALDPERRALYDVEYRTVGKEDGLTRWVAAKGRGIFDGSGRCVRVIGTAIDITARKQAEAALDEANRRKDEFLAMLAHELRNPLAPIGNASELLSRKLASDARAQAAIGMIKRQVTQLTRLVDDLLDVSRITQGLIRLHKRPVDLAAVITQALETVEPQMREKQHTLSITSSYEPLYVNGDFARLVQCVGNILANAIKYTEPRGEIRVRTRGDAHDAFIEISDTGAGIAADLLPRVFDLFVQSERTLDRSEGGLGVGLAVVKRLAEMHDGDICVRSAGIGQGSSFELKLPRAARPEAAAGAAAPIQAQPRRILIVDDNADAANSLSMLLSFVGHEINVAYNAKDALACAASFKPDVGLLDIGLPEINGYELAEQLRGIPELESLRLIALTGYGQPDDLQRALAAGFEGHLVKPVDLSALERTLAGI